MNQDQDLIKAARTLVEIAGKGTEGDWVHRKPPEGSSQEAYDSGFVEAPGKHKQGYGIQILGDDEEGYPTKKEDIAAIVALHNSLHLITQLADALEVSGKALRDAADKAERETNLMPLRDFMEINDVNEDFALGYFNACSSFRVTVLAMLNKHLEGN